MPRPLRLAALLLLTACQPDRTAPVVTGTYPRANAVGVPTNAVLQVQFSEPMDRTATEAAFMIVPAAPGTFNWSASGFLFQPDTLLLPNTACTMAIGAGTSDEAGNPLESAYVVPFTTGDSAVAVVQVSMLGRSVMYGWFQHWETDPWQPYTRDRFTLTYHEVQPPPDIVTSVKTYIDSLTSCQNPAVFFKLCFDDFTGADSFVAAQNLERNLRYVQQVYDTVVTRRGLKLILGNALPRVAGRTDGWLVWNHRQYNQRLLEFAAAHNKVKVFDLYTVLTETDGTLKSTYASSSDDSHPNEAGYSALDAPFFDFLEANY